MIKVVSILGCGWLGLPLAQYLIKDGYLVKGTTSTESKLNQLKDKGIIPFLAQLDPGLKISDDDFFDTDILIINIPPSTFKNGPDFHPQQMASLSPYIKKHKVKNIIYVSSTSVYPETNGVVDEAMNLTIENDRQKALLLAEQELLNHENVTILRCGGLMGYDRQPVRFLNMNTRNKSRRSSDTPVNYIHRDDVVEIIYRVIKKECTGEIFNLVAPKHPLRKYFMKEFEEEENINSSFKIVSSEKIVQFLDYTFIYPDPLQFDQK